MLYADVRIIFYYFSSLASSALDHDVLTLFFCGGIPPSLIRMPHNAQGLVSSPYGMLDESRYGWPDYG